MEVLGISRAQSLELAKLLDDAGYIIMPIEPTSQMLSASMVAMRGKRWFDGTPDAVQRIKHMVRYRAMVEQQRRNLGLSEAHTQPEVMDIAIQAGRDMAREEKAQ